MSAVEILGVAASLSLLAGWRLYLTVFVTGLAMKFGVLPLPDQLSSLSVLANPWVIGAAGLGLSAEFLADKIAWIDSGWNLIHSWIRPLGGALLSLAVVDASDPVWQVATFLLGGGGALLSASAKSATRAVVNTSPEPFSNVAVSASEDIATGGLLALALARPDIAAIIAAMLAVAAVAVLLVLRRLLAQLGRLGTGADRPAA